jgi:hypothetical protein
MDCWVGLGSALNGGTVASSTAMMTPADRNICRFTAGRYITRDIPAQADPVRGAP